MNGSWRRLPALLLLLAVVLVAAVRELRRRGVARVLLVSSSMGGTAVLVAAGRIRPRARPCAASSPPTWADEGPVSSSAAMARWGWAVLRMRRRPGSS